MNKPRRVCFSLAYVLAACASTAPAFAVNEDAPILVTASLSNQQVSVGEPVSVNLNIVNQSVYGLTVDINDGGNRWEDAPASWFSLHLTDKSGSDNIIGKQLNHFYNGAYSTVKLINKGELLVNPTPKIQCFTIQSPGNYDLVIHIQLPYKKDKDEIWRHYTEDVHFPVTVTKSDPANLEILANSLYNRYLQVSIDTNRDLLLRSLFAIPANITQQYLHQLATSSRFKDADAMADVLSADDSVDHASILAELCLYHPESKSAMIQLFSLYRRGNDNVKHAIETVYNTHGQELPPAPAIRVD